MNERHSCAFGSRRFGHLVMEYHGRVVSLLMTANDEGARGAETDEIPHLIGRPMNGLSVMSVDGAHHAILLVSDLSSIELAQVARAVSMPLAQRAARGVTREPLPESTRAGAPNDAPRGGGIAAGLTVTRVSGVPHFRSECR